MNKPTMSMFATVADYEAAIAQAALDAPPAVQPEPIAYVNQRDIDALKADKWAMVEATAYTVMDSENIPLYAAPSVQPVPNAAMVMLTMGELESYDIHPSVAREIMRAFAAKNGLRVEGQP